MRDVQSQTRTRAMLITALGSEIVAALDDPAVVEIMINPDGRLWIERHGSGRSESGLVVTAGDVERVIRLVASHMGRPSCQQSCQWAESGSKASCRRWRRGLVSRSANQRDGWSLWVSMSPPA